MRRYALSLLFSILTLFIGLYTVGHFVRIDWSSWHALRRVAPAFWVLGLGMAATEVGLRALRLRLIGWHVGEKLSWRTILRVNFACDFFAALTPGRIGGEISRFVGLKKATQSAAQTGLILAIEALSEGIFLALAATVFLLVVGERFPVLFKIYQGLLTTVVVFAVVVWWVQRARGGRFEKWEALRAQIRLVTSRRLWVLPLAVLICSGFWGVRFLSLAWIAPALGGALGWQDIFWRQFLILRTVNFTPLPFNGGMVEASFLTLYQNLFPAETLLAAAILWRLFTHYLFVGIGALWMSNRLSEIWQAIIDRSRQTARPPS